MLTAQQAREIAESNKDGELESILFQIKSMSELGKNSTFITEPNSYTIEKLKELGYSLEVFPISLGNYTITW